MRVSFLFFIIVALSSLIYGQTADHYHQKGLEYKSLGDFSAAIKKFDKAIELNPNRASSFNHRGYSYRMLNEYYAAIQDYDRAIELNPNSEYYYNRRGYARQLSALYSEAIEDFNKAIEINPNNAVFFGNRGYSHMMLGNYEASVSDYDQAIQLNPDIARYYDERKDAKQLLDKLLQLSAESRSVEQNQDFFPDVVVSIPETKLTFPNRFALIIGNENYSSYQQSMDREINVDFAINDAKIIKEYFVKVFGIPEKNSTLVINATAAQILQGVDRLSRLAAASEGQAELFFYYAGHGLADQNTRESYLIPVDVSGGNLEYAVKLQTIYNKLSEYPTKRTVIFLDACFSGGARNEPMLAMRGVRVRPRKNILNGNMLVMASSSDTESSQPYPERKHGLFTYFMLKKIQETQGEITYSDLYSYVRRRVAIESILNKDQPQTPAMMVSPDIETEWHNWYLNK